jgi:hypothetical protein
MSHGDETPATKAAHGADPHERRRKVVSGLRLEIEKIVARILFLWVMFGLFELLHTVILVRQNIDYTAHGLALFNAIVMSKVLLIAEDMNFASRFHESRLIYSIIYKSAMFSVLFMVVHLAEETIKGVIGGHGLMASLPHIDHLSVVVCTAAILFIALLPYFAFREVGRVMGQDKLWALILKERKPLPAAEA